MELTLRENAFSGSDLIMVLDFLSRFVSEANALSMSEAQAVVDLPYIMRGDAAAQLKSAYSSSGISAWPKAVNPLLQTYATPRALAEGKEAFQEARQQAGEMERAFATRLTSAPNKCGNISPEWERMTTFIYELNTTINSLVARNREATPRGELNFAQLVH